MDPRQIGKQMLDINKKAFDNSFAAMSTVQVQAEKAFVALMEKSVWVPKEMNSFMSEGINVYKWGCDQLKANAEESFRKMEALLSASEDNTTKTAGKPKSH